MSQNHIGILNDSTDLIFQKEKEWRDLLVSELEKAKLERNRAELLLNEFRERYFKLEIDFKHNLVLLNERDKELNDLEDDNITIRELLHDNEEKISSLSVEIDQLKIQLRNAEEIKLDLKEKLQQVMNKSFKDVQIVKNEKIKEIEKLKDENAEKVKGLERKIIQIEAESSDYQHSLMADVEETLRSREGELKRQAEQVHTEMLNYELKYRLASKELELSKASKADIMRRLTEKEEMIREMEMRFSELELAGKSELSIERMNRETEALKSREIITNLSKEIEHLTTKLNDRKNQLNTKAELAKRLEGEIKSVLNTAREKEHEKLQRIDNLELELERLNKSIEELQVQLLVEKENVVKKDLELSVTVVKLREECARKDGEVRNGKLELDRMMEQVRTKQQELLELRAELEYAIARDGEATMSAFADKEVWQRKLEQVRIEEMSKVESMIKAITKGRDDALADVRELRAQLEDKKTVRMCSNCTRESGSPDHRPLADVPHADNAEIANLRRQNEQLKTVISQMTEQATNEASRCQTQSGQPAAVAASTNKHIAQLAERNRELQHEKIELLATGRKLQARLEAAEADSAAAKRTLRTRETEVTQLKFELDSQQRHTGMDARSLRRTVQELETELAVSRREAEEYYKGNLELGRALEELQAELTSLQAGREERCPGLAFGAQEMLIEQLRAEIKALRTTLSDSARDPGEATDRNSVRYMDGDSGVLRKKLKAAVTQIRSLASEKQVLIQISNRLRAELKSAGLKIPGSHGTGVKQPVSYVTGPDENRAVKSTLNDLEAKLCRLEQLQQNLRSQANDREPQDRQPERRSARDPVESSVGCASVDEVFRLLDDYSDSLGGQSSVVPDHKGKESAQQPVNNETRLLWSKSAKLNSPRTRPKRNFVINR